MNLLCLQYSLDVLVTSAVLSRCNCYFSLNVSMYLLLLQYSLDVLVHDLLHQRQRYCAALQYLFVEIADVEFLAQRFVRLPAQLHDFELADFVRAGLGWEGAVARHLSADELGRERCVLREKCYGLVVTPPGKKRSEAFNLVV
jgi:hypothetical protein